ncbi:DNA polymerase III subunit chi [Salinimonas sediminis]|uniref:DNA polymerase III subunit chi n=1 Tax=Salinimonas sediminis TaxID=2303538 RepID=A0A346NPZ7_9ALTE|nr:DNA polymerase III subunit chi [Salinimonas sediminis]AXR07604.1 DNA polymerase III subunit chi [Salinimonas sediminis]
MPQATFYQLQDSQDAGPVRACEIIASAYAAKQRCAVLCLSKSQAEALDDLLWQLPANRFVPHNMAGEGPSAGTPVEICWDPAQLSRRQLLVNLSESLPDAFGQFQHIVDFVPAADEAKKAARIRYKQFQQAGCQMQFKSA